MNTKIWDLWGLKPDGRVDYEEFMRLWMSLSRRQQAAIDGRSKAVEQMLAVPDDGLVRDPRVFDYACEARLYDRTLKILKLEGGEQLRLFEAACAAGLVDSKFSEGPFGQWTALITTARVPVPGCGGRGRHGGHGRRL